MGYHVMLDLETLGTSPSAAIVQIGAVLFEPKSGGRVLNNKIFNRFVMVQEGAGHIDHSTLTFWLQEKAAPHLGKNLAENAFPLDQVLAEFIEWPYWALTGNDPREPHVAYQGNTHPYNWWQQITGVWAKPSNFDIAILQSAFRLFGKAPPWNHRATRCMRTVLDILGHNPQVAQVGTTHDAADDALYQVMQLQIALGELGVNLDRR